MKAEPVALGAAIRLTILAAVSLGLELDGTQVMAIMAAVEAWLAVLTRNRVTPVAE